MAELAAFAVSAALAQLLTNLDNLAVLAALMLTGRQARMLSGYLTAQAIVLLAAMGVAAGMGGILPGRSGYLGLLPIALGLHGIWRQISARSGAPIATRPGVASLTVITLLFLGLSTDSFAVLAPLLADSAPAFRLAALTGAAAASVGLGALALSGSRVAAGPLGRIERLAPYAMILAGLYVLSNSATDTLP